VESHLRIGRIQLHVKGGRLDGFMVVAGEPCGTVGGGVGDAEVLRKSRPLVL
jgi:ribosomal protein S5